MSVYVKIVKFDLGRMYCVTTGALAVMLPEATFSMPGTAATLSAMELPNVVELPIADCAASRSMSPSGTLATTTIEPESSCTTISAGSITTPRVPDISAAIDACTARMKEALMLASAIRSS
jgi:hypothetical protein